MGAGLAGARPQFRPLGVPLCKSYKMVLQWSANVRLPIAESCSAWIAKSKPSPIETFTSHREIINDWTLIKSEFTPK